jgi:predicted ATPase
MLVLETGLEENLEEAFEIKIRRSPKLMKRALVTAAYARSTIDIDTLFTLMEMHDQSRPSSRQSPPLELGQLSKALDRAVLEGFLLNNIGSKYYSFAHNKVLQASYSLVPEGKPRERFRLSMGRKLYELGLSYSNKDDAGGETWMLFAAAEHLNSSISLIDTDPLFLAHMNLYIGERAAKISAYDQASKCLLAGLDALTMIPDYDPWEEEYDLTLRLHRAVADIELYLGRFDRGNEIGRRLLEKARDLQDGLPTFEALALALGREELHAEGESSG